VPREKRAWTKNKTVQRIMDVIGDFAPSDKDWLHLALACIDQCGYAKTTDAVEQLLFDRGELEE